jgi:hypothetical protein
MADKQGALIDLITGNEVETSLRKVIAERANGETPRSPVLLLLKG